jgi:hypothetical protein
MTEWTPQRLDDLAERLLASPHIVRLSGGPMGTVATYLPGRRIPGLRVGDDDRIEIHVVMAPSSTVDDIEAGVIRALDDASSLGSLHIDDIDIVTETVAAAIERTNA